MNLLITGGAGYIGSHTVLQLKQAGHFTVVYDNFENSDGSNKFLLGDEFVKGDIADSRKVEETLKKFKIDAVLHFAAYIEAGESMKDPAKFFRNNSSGTFSLLETMIRCGVNRFIFSSTAALFGFPDKVPIVEDSPLKPVNAYGESKLLVEKVLSWYSELLGFKYVSLRYFNACGADAALRTGEAHIPESHLIPLALQTAYGARKEFFIHGTDYKTPDGTCVRDYIHVSDLAKAHLLALEYLVKENKSDIFNLGSETGYSVREVVESVKKVTGKSFQVTEGPRRPGDPDILVASSAKIRKKLGWKPEYRNLESIIRTASDFYKKWNKLN